MRDWDSTTQHTLIVNIRSSIGAGLQVRGHRLRGTWLLSHAIFGLDQRRRWGQILKLAVATRPEPDI